MSDTKLASPPPAVARASGAGGTTAIEDLAGSLKARPRAVTLYGAPEGYDAAVVGRLVVGGAARRWLHVCRDDGRMARFAAALAFFNPEIEALTFPAWDCLPYDRVSPNSELVSRRIDTLTRLASAPAQQPAAQSRQAPTLTLPGRRGSETRGRQPGRRGRWSC